MKEQKTIKTALMVAAAGILTLVVIVLCYYLINEPDEASHIALPDYSVIPSDQPDLPDESDLLADVTPENVQRVLESITPLEAYHQELTQEYFWADGSAVRTAELWRRGDEQKLRCTGPDGAVEQFLLRRDEGWVWYDGEAPVLLSEQRPSAWDLIGIPDYLHLTSAARILDAAYATLAGSDQTSCLYIKWDRGEERTVTCWIDVETGLLVRAVAEENGAMVYRMQQESVERLLPGDEAYNAPFELPGAALEN